MPMVREPYFLGAVAAVPVVVGRSHLHPPHAKVVPGKGDVMQRIAKPLWLLIAGLGCSSMSSPLPPTPTPPPTPPPPSNLARLPDGVLLRLGDAFLKLEVCANDVLRVAYAKDQRFFARQSLAAQPKRCAGAAFEVTESEGSATVATAKLRARIDLGSGRVAFLDGAGSPILEEKEGGRTLMPAVIQGEHTQHVRQEWLPDADEAFYGLGENQMGLLNLKGYDLDLWQHNGTIVIPFLVSSRGFGIFWDNTSFTRFGDLRELLPIPAERLFDKSGKRGGLSGAYYRGANFDRLVGERVDRIIDIALSSKEKKPNQLIFPGLPPGPASVRWQGEIEPELTGEYTFETFSNGGIKVWLDERLVIDHWRQDWLPWKEVAKVRLAAKRRCPIRVEWTKDQAMETVQLLWKPPIIAMGPSEDPIAPRDGARPAKLAAPHATAAAAAPATTSLWSEVGDGIDYYLVYGPELDNVVAGYRRITGTAPMIPRWALGLWQSRQRYETAKQSLAAVDGFRARKIPFDNIVQDWFYWKEDSWGSHEFDKARFPDPEGWIRDIHARHARLMISVWGKFYPGTKNFEAMRAQGFLYQRNLSEGLRDWVGDGGYPYTFYDAFHPEAGRLFWSQIEQALFRKQVDAWWLDAPEPDLLPTPTLDGQRTHMHPTALGTGARMLNAYSLANSKSVYEGQRAAAPDQRVFILTRSAFAGQQRYGTAVWSGDITSTWTALRQQIPAGLGLSVSGLPYWSMDIGGFSVPARFSAKQPTPEDAEEWRELNARWFQFGTFVPLLRVHGEAPKREMWELGGEAHPAYKSELKFDRIRYRLLPYLYSLAGAVTHAGGTIMRPLVMDFRTDARALAVSDQYLLGPAFLVSPVTTYKARSRSVYLPKAAGWYDFWWGTDMAPGQTIAAPAPYDSMPVHVRAGAIVPMGPELQYTDEKPADPIVLWVYAGADGQFTLYEDDGLSYGYEKGAFARIPIRWHDATRMLTIGQREGSFAGMLKERTFQVVLVAKDKPVGFSFAPKADKTVRYEGAALELKL
jgi:alpha-D-xyloside xylohydrolase